MVNNVIILKANKILILFLKIIMFFRGSLSLLSKNPASLVVARAGVKIKNNYKKLKIIIKVLSIIL